MYIDIPEDKETTLLEKFRYEFRKFVIHNLIEGGREIITIDGFDTAGKTSNSEILTSASTGFDTNVCNRFSMDVPTDEEMKLPITKWYEEFFPGIGKTIIFDRGWNNRAFAQYPNGWCSKEQYEDFLDSLSNELEKFLENSYSITSFFFYITKQTQKRRLKNRKDDPMKEFRLSESDKKAPKHYDKIMHALKKVEQAYAKSPVAFHIIDSESKKEALLELLKCLLKDADYPKKSKELSFTLNRKLVKASVDEIIEVEKTKQE